MHLVLPKVPRRKLTVIHENTPVDKGHSETTTWAVMQRAIHICHTITPLHHQKLTDSPNTYAITPSDHHKPQHTPTHAWPLTFIRPTHDLHSITSHKQPIGRQHPACVWVCNKVPGVTAPQSCQQCPTTVVHTSGPPPGWHWIGQLPIAVGQPWLSALQGTLTWPGGASFWSFCLLYLTHPACYEAKQTQKALTCCGTCLSTTSIRGLRDAAASSGSW